MITTVIMAIMTMMAADEWMSGQTDGGGGGGKWTDAGWRAVKWQFMQMGLMKFRVRAAYSIRFYCHFSLILRELFSTELNANTRFAAANNDDNEYSGHISALIESIKMEIENEIR